MSDTDTTQTAVRAYKTTRDQLRELSQEMSARLGTTLSMTQTLQIVVSNALTQERSHAK